MALLRTSAYDNDKYTSISAPRSMLEAQQARMYAPRSMLELQQAIAERPQSMLELQQATHTPFNEQLGENFTPVGQIPRPPTDPLRPPSQTTAPVAEFSYQTPNVYLPGLNGQTASYQQALNRLAMGGSPYEALGGLLAAGERAPQQGNGGYVGSNASSSGLLGATPINTGLPSGYQPPTIPGTVPPTTPGGLPGTGPATGTQQPPGVHLGPLSRSRPPRGLNSAEERQANRTPDQVNMDLLQDNWSNSKKQYGVGSPEAQLAHQAFELAKYDQFVANRQAQGRSNVYGGGGPGALTPEQQTMLDAQLAAYVPEPDRVRNDRWDNIPTRMADPMEAQLKYLRQMVGRTQGLERLPWTKALSEMQANARESA